MNGTVEVIPLTNLTQGVLAVDRWYQGSVVIPLAGMTFAVSMNTVSLAAERYEAETRRGSVHSEARHIALRSALIPQINSLFAVGLVSFPGMDDGANPLRRRALSCGALSDHGHEHALRAGRNLGGVFPLASKARAYSASEITLAPRVLTGPM